MPSFASLFLLLLLASVLSSARFFSTAGRFPYREIFTLPVKILAASVIVAYVGMLSVSLILQKKCEEGKIALGKHFNRPLTVEALKKAALGSEKGSDAFWKKIDELYQKDKNHETAYSLAEFTPSQLASWRKRFESSKIFPELDRMISTPLPPFSRKIEKYNLACTLMPDLKLLRYMARVQVWHCRFAAEKGDRTAAVAALKRMDHLSAYLAKQPSLIGALVKLAIDAYKIRAVEILLGARLLNKDDLLALKRQSRMIRQHRERVERDILWSEALCGLDYTYEPTSRMTNTFIDNGPDKNEDIIASIEYGLYAKSMGGGSVNPLTGAFNFAVTEGYIVRNGKICEAVRGASLIGTGSDILQDIDMVGQNLATGQGMCGSSSGSVPTDVGQPLIRVSKITVGGR